MGLSGEMRSTPILDEAVLDGVREVLDPPMMAQLIEVLERSVAETIVDWTAAIAEDNLYRSQRAAHKLKGSAGNVGLRRVWTLALALEKAETLDEARKLGTGLTPMMDEGLAVLKKVLAL